MTTESSAARAKFFRSQTATIAEGLAFALDEEDAARRFRDLAMETYDALVAAGQPPLYAFGFHSGGYGKPPIPSKQLPLLSRDLLRRWQEWSSEYRAVMARQPRQALHEALCLISYSHDRASWPGGYEWKILNWIESGKATPLPFDDRDEIATLQFYGELRSLRQRSRGWLYCELRSDGSRAVVFVPDDRLAPWYQKEAARYAEWKSRYKKSGEGWEPQ